MYLTNSEKIDVCEYCAKPRLESMFTTAYVKDVDGEISSNEMCEDCADYNLLDDGYRENTKQDYQTRLNKNMMAIRRYNLAILNSIKYKFTKDKSLRRHIAKEIRLSADGIMAAYDNMKHNKIAYKNVRKLKV